VLRADVPARSGGGEALRRGRELLAAFQVEEALAELERALADGPHDHAQLAAIYEQLGIAYAYLERNERALAAFDMLLDLEPGHLLSYELSPKATFVFERARKQAGAAPAVDLDWPHDLAVGEAVPIDVEVVADPRAFLKGATLHVRRRGEREWRALDFELAPAGQRARALMPAIASERAETLEIWLSANDRRGNEVLVWAEPARPRTIPLRWDPPPPWWSKWWVWVIVGGVVATGTGTVVYAVTQDEPDLVGATFGSD
jgi:tetratricopeptide (TPR) repeat protein